MSVKHMMHVLSHDIQWYVYRKYFSMFVVPAISHKNNKCSMICEPDVSTIRHPLLLDNGMMLSTFSQVDLYGRYGAEVDITELSPSDRFYVYQELEKAEGQILVRGGCIFVATPHWARSKREHYVFQRHMRLKKTYETIIRMDEQLAIIRYGLQCKMIGCEDTRDLPVAYHTLHAVNK